jgi:hypothetical protein
VGSGCSRFSYALFVFLRNAFDPLLDAATEEGKSGCLAMFNVIK